MFVKKNKKVAILDHGSRIVSFISHILSKLDYKYKITKSTNDLDNLDYLIILSIGSYFNYMKKINYLRLNNFNNVKCTELVR